MGGAEIVSVDYQQFRVRGMTEPLGYRLGLGRKRCCNQER